MAGFTEIASMWESMSGWFTPTILFCIANLIVATIFIASNKNQNQNHLHGNSKPLTRMSSFLDRAKSFDLRSYNTSDSHHQYPSQPSTAIYGSSSRLAQSIHFDSNLPELTTGNESDQISDAPGQLARAPSFIDRVKSFKISSPFKSENVDTYNPSDKAEPHVMKSKSEKKPTTKSLPDMKKSRSEMRITSDDDDDEDVDLRRPATARERRSEVEEEVDSKADDFISRFKKQLKLQRLESLVRYNEMLNRGR